MDLMPDNVHSKMRLLMEEFFKSMGFGALFIITVVAQRSKQPSVQMFAPEIILLVHYLCPACLDRERAGVA